MQNRLPKKYFNQIQYAIYAILNSRSTEQEKTWLLEARTLIKQALDESLLDIDSAKALKDYLNKHSSVHTGDPSSIANLHFFLNQRDSKAINELIKKEQKLTACKAELKAHRHNAGAYNNLGNAFYELAKYPEAIKAYDKALEIKPQFAVVHNNRGHALSCLRKFQDALAAYNMALGIEPQYLEALLGKGDSHYSLAEPNEALTVYVSILRNDPKFVRAHIGRGHALKELKRHEAALAAYDTVIAINPTSIEAHAHRGYTLKILDKKDAAKRAFLVVLTRNPNFLKVRNEFNELNQLNYEEYLTQQQYLKSVNNTIKKMGIFSRVDKEKDDTATITRESEDILKIVMDYVDDSLQPRSQKSYCSIL